MPNIEQWIVKEGLKPILKTTMDGHEVSVADDESPHFDSSEFPGGYYITTYAVGRGRQVIAQPLYFDATHEDMTSRSPKARTAARINAALANAKSWIRDAKLAGWYE